MAYKSKYTNFEDFDDEILETVKAAARQDQSVKDVICREIDEFIEAVVSERVEQSQFLLNLDDDGFNVGCDMGDKTEYVDGEAHVDTFFPCVSLTGLIDQALDIEFDDPDVCEQFAVELEALAARCRARAKKESA